jgi:hypothetical protein
MDTTIWIDISIADVDPIFNYPFLFLFVVLFLFLTFLLIFVHQDIQS